MVTLATAQHGTQAPATARHTSPGVALRVSPLSMGGNQNEKPTHASSSLAFYRKEKSSWLNRSVLGTPKPQGMEAGEGLSAEFGVTPRALHHNQNFLGSLWAQRQRGCLSLSVMEKYQSWKADNASSTDEPRPGGHHLFC